MDAPVNSNNPLIMHIDLNSAYAMIEQQANPLIRSKPVAVAAYDTPQGMIIASSYEAKAKGIKLGINVAKARSIDPNVIILMPDPEKYFDAHRRLRAVLLSYTSKVVPRSVDEFVMDFEGSQAIGQGKSMQEIGRKIKQDIKKSLGSYVTVNIGIGPSRFLAKTAAGLNKPDGLDTVASHNLREVYKKLDLIDLTGINTRYKARLKAAGIHTPLQFLEAPAHLLRRRVFKSITGYHWYLRLRGYEVDDAAVRTRSFSQQYALGDKTVSRQELSRLLMKLSEKTGRRLRKHGYIAYGVRLLLEFEDYKRWNRGRKQKSDIYSTQDIYVAAQRLMDDADIHCRVRRMSVAVYDLERVSSHQQSLFDGARLDRRSLALAVDQINDRYGEFTIAPALMANM